MIITTKKDFEGLVLPGPNGVGAGEGLQLEFKGAGARPERPPQHRARRRRVR